MREQLHPRLHGHEPLPLAYRPSYLHKRSEVDIAVERWRRLVPYALDATGSAELLRRLRNEL